MSQRAERQRAQAERMHADVQAELEERLTEWRMQAHGRPMAEHQVEVAAGYLQAVLEASARFIESLPDGGPYPDPDARIRRMGRALEEWYRMVARFWWHYRDRLAGPLRHDPEDVAALWTSLRSDPSLARALDE